MKIVHTADWHIGKVVNEFSMLCDQKYYLDKLKSLLVEKQADLLIIAGDLYDRSVPSAEAVSLVNEFLCDVVLNHKIKVLCISGNHDSGERISFASKLFENSGLYMCGMLNDSGVKKVTLTDEFGDVNFYLLPYIEPSYIRATFSNTDIHTFDDAYGFITEKMMEDMDMSQRNVLIAHGNFSVISDLKSDTGVLDSSEVSVGGADLVNAARFSSFDYVALGHLHESKRAGSEHIRYSGSLLKYSIDEANQNKEIPIITLNKKGNTDISFSLIKPMRDIKIISGKFDDILNAEYDKELSEDYVFASLSDSEPVIDAILRLRAKFPNIMGLKYSSKFAKENIIVTTEAIEQKTPELLFYDFYNAMTNEEIDDEQKTIIHSAYENVIKE